VGTEWGPSPLRPHSGSVDLHESYTPAQPPAHDGASHSLHEQRLAILHAMAVALTRSLVLAVALASTGCSNDPVVWRDEVDAMPLAPYGALLTLDASGSPRFVPGAAGTTLPFTDICPGTPRVTAVPRGTTRALVAVWWAPRKDGSARLLAAESVDGGLTWPTVVPIDTLDRGTNGCARPAPAVAADSSTGYVHVAYPLWAPEGPGVFFAHTMPGHFMFHTPSVVSYGDRPGEVSVAASGEVVVVAYEDPNARAPRIGLALSRSQGHVFEHRVLAGASPGDASSPRVALRGHLIALSWTRVPLAVASLGGSAAAALQTSVRIGTVRP
jgi:hypothetical protein